ncbi:hypothetical protein LP43_0768 [Methylophaga thiooxydans]|uniref:Uncharacterized protein n=2 Tax=Methylophaga thiooxydans TaxID=392484 RepID=C0N6E0_9GAMM|nr:hypothetical protein MDMS009_2078 [Methylophaga thiooxydans DMS010]KGM07160.1 hypothetical protein LP43_0768 [Methylophaga thiooxydans]
MLTLSKQYKPANYSLLVELHAQKIQNSPLKQILSIGLPCQ